MTETTEFLEQLLERVAHSEDRVRQLRADLHRATLKADRLRETFLDLIDDLPEADRQWLLDQFWRTQDPVRIDTRNASPLFREILEVVRQRRGECLDREAVDRQLRSAGLKPDPKKTLNALDHLRQRGALRRVERGRYVVNGIEIITSDDLENEGNEGFDAR